MIELMDFFLSSIESKTDASFLFLDFTADLFLHCYMGIKACLQP